MNYCSLDEAWGSTPVNIGNSNTQNYSSFEQEIKTNNTQQNLNNSSNLNSVKNIDLDNQTNKLVINSKMKHNKIEILFKLEIKSITR